MWPFTPRRSPEEQAVDRAIDLAAATWRHFCETSPLPPNIHLRDRIAFFLPDFRDVLTRRAPVLAEAEDDTVMQIVARGVERSGTHDRRHIERGLGIVLPN